MKHTRRVVAAGSALLAGVILSGCSVATSQPDMVILHYQAGSFSATKFQDCVAPSHRETNGPGDKYYAYPANQRTFDASNAQGADAEPIHSVSKDNAEMAVPVVVSFDLTTDCKLLQKFHETLGNRYHAYWDKDQASDNIPKGWEELLGVIIDKPLDITIDRVVQQYNWRDLYSKPDVRVALQEAVEKELPQLSQIRQGGTEFFTNWSVLVQKPDPVSQDLKNAIAAQQSGIAAAQAAQAKAAAEQAQAQAEIAVARAEAEKKKAEIRGYGGYDNYLKHECIEKGCNPYQPSYGQPVGETHNP